MRNTWIIYRNGCVMALLLLSSAIFAQQFDKERLDAIMEHLEKNNRAMGTISLSQNGKTMYERSVGYLDYEQKVKASPQSLYAIGSVSKTYTAAMIMVLVEKGKLKLDDRLSQFFPQIPQADQITIEHLLQHRTGIFNFTADPSFFDWNTQTWDRAQLVEKIRAYDRQFQPGAQMQYSNSNYVLLSYIIEDLTKKSYNDALQQLIAKPCKINNTRISEFTDLAIGTHSYTKYGEWKREEVTSPTITLGSGGIFSSASQVNQFMHCLHEGKLLNKENLQKMKELKEGYGFGLIQVPFYEHLALGHTGGIDGFRSQAFYFEKDKIAYTYLSNAEDYPINEIAILVLSEIFGKEYDLPEFTENIPLDKSLIKSYIGNYTADNFPLEILVQEKNGQITIFPTGQMEVPVNHLGNHTFSFDQAGLKLIFEPEKNIMHLHQQGMHFVLQRKIATSGIIEPIQKKE